MEPSRRPHRRVLLGLLLLLGTASGAAAAVLDDPGVGTPILQLAPRPQGSLRVASLNMAHGRGAAFHQALVPDEVIAQNLRAAGELIASIGADVVGLQELDGPSFWSGGTSHLTALGLQSGLRSGFHGLHVDAAPLGLPLAYGTGLLSAHPLDGQRSVPFDATWRDTKGLAVATVRTPQLGPVDVASIHLDFLSSDVRATQVERALAELRARHTQEGPRPLVVMGDFNCDWSEAGCVARLAAELDLHAYEPERGVPSFPASAPWRRVDWILASRDLEFADYHTVATGLSDHLGVVATLRPAQQATGAWAGLRRAPRLDAEAPNERVDVDAGHPVPPSAP